jgi:hypothetical protein
MVAALPTHSSPLLVSRALRPGCRDRRWTLPRSWGCACCRRLSPTLAHLNRPLGVRTVTPHTAATSAPSACAEHLAPRRIRLFQARTNRAGLPEVRPSSTKRSVSSEPDPGSRLAPESGRLCPGPAPVHIRRAVVLNGRVGDGGVCCAKVRRSSLPRRRALSCGSSAPHERRSSRRVSTGAWRWRWQATAEPAFRLTPHCHRLSGTMIVMPGSALRARPPRPCETAATITTSALHRRRPGAGLIRPFRARSSLPCLSGRLPRLAPSSTFATRHRRWSRTPPAAHPHWRGPIQGSCNR